MKKLDRIIILYLLSAILVVSCINIFYFRASKKPKNKEYNVEIERLSREIELGNTPDLSKCKYVVGYEKYENDQNDNGNIDAGNDIAAGNFDESFFKSNYSYAVKLIDGEIYRFDYKIILSSNARLIIAFNTALILISIFVLIVLLYVRNRIMKPFNRISELPYELARGNLTVPIEENKYRFFGKFTWGLDMLREKLEDNKKKELALQKEKQTLVLSISHDIKTPLSAIKLSSKALIKGIYKDEEKKLEVAEGINAKADEIEGFVEELIESAGDDFLNLEVRNGDFYISQLIAEIKKYYVDKFDVIKTEFVIDDFKDCIVKGDIDRSIEVIQNILENAIKYGDGKKVSISFSDEENCRLVTVKNTGCTLAASELVHIFDSFWRGSNSESKSGSGLGLYICRKLMYAMNGDIFAQITDGNMCVTVVFVRC